MFDHLIESRKKRDLRTLLGNSTASIIVHAVAITLAVYATLHAGQQVAEKIHQVTMVMAEPDKPKEEPPKPQEVAQVNPPPKGFQTLSIPTTIPVDIPPPSQTSNFNASDFSGVGVEGGVSTGVVGGTGPVVTDQPYLEAVVEERPEAILSTCISPRYPAILQQAGIQGSVLAEFIIDTLGRVERNSFKVVNSSHPLFDGPARDAIMSCRYKPGRISGRAVRVRVQQPVNFSISR